MQEQNTPAGFDVEQHRIASTIRVSQRKSATSLYYFYYFFGSSPRTEDQKYTIQANQADRVD